MLSIPDAARIYYCATPVKMSRSYDGLCGAVRSALGRDPCEAGSIFVFVNRRRTMVKVLCWEGDGFSIWGKRLERGQFNLPPSADGRIVLEYRELVAMLAGIRPGRYYRRHNSALTPA